MLPVDTITYFEDIMEAGTYNISSPPTTVMGVYLQLRGDKLTEVICGSDLVFATEVKTRDNYVKMNYICNDTLAVRTSSGDNVFALINYVPYSVMEASTTNQINIKNGISYGDILTNYFLFIILVGCIFGFLVKNFIIKRK